MDKLLLESKGFIGKFLLVLGLLAILAAMLYMIGTEFVLIIDTSVFAIVIFIMIIVILSAWFAMLRVYKRRRY